MANRQHFTAGTIHCGKAADSVILYGLVGFREELMRMEGKA